MCLTHRSNWCQFISIRINTSLIMMRECLLHADQVNVNVVAVARFVATSPSFNLKTMCCLQTVFDGYLHSGRFNFWSSIRSWFGPHWLTWVSSMPLGGWGLEQIWPDSSSLQIPCSFLWPSSHSHTPHLVWKVTNWWHVSEKAPVFWKVPKWNFLLAMGEWWTVGCFK